MSESNPTSAPDISPTGRILKGMKKASAPATIVYRADQLKPCQIDPPAPGKTVGSVRLEFVRDGKVMHLPCSPILFKAFEQERFDQYTTSDFLIHTLNGVAVRIEPVQRHDYQHRMVPEGLADVKHAIYRVSPSDGWAVAEKWPPRIPRNTIIAIKQELDRLTEINQGDTILGQYDVVDVIPGLHDHQVLISVPHR